MLMWALKKYIVSKINSVLNTYKDNVQSFREKLNKVIQKTQTLLVALQHLSEKLDDNELSNEEVDQTIEEIETIVKDW